ncbi:MAG: isoprenylcysteine carboxylmethyltransferase family protein [Bacteroidota bacterium]
MSSILVILGVMVVQSSFRKFKPKEFTELQHVRHPIYSGVILLVVGFFFFIPNLPTLISCACILIYIPIGIYLEEKKLVATYGDQYIEFRKKVPAIIPEKLMKEIS